MEVLIKGRWFQASRMEKARPFIVTVMCMRALMSRVNVKDMAFIRFRTVRSMMENGSKTSSTVVALIIS